MRFLPAFLALLFTTFAACTEASTSDGSSDGAPPCSIGSDGKCVATDQKGNTFCDVDRGPSSTPPDAVYFLVCTAGEICGIKDGRKTFSCCAPAPSCVAGYVAAP